MNNTNCINSLLISPFFLYLLYPIQMIIRNETLYILGNADIIVKIPTEVDSAKRYCENYNNNIVPLIPLKFIAGYVLRNK